MASEDRQSHRAPLQSGNRPEGMAVATLDKIGATASLTCAIHCAIMPLIITLLPLLGLSFLADDRVEWALLGLSAAIGVSSLCMGYREHGSRRALTVLAVGIALVTAGRILESRHFGPWGIVAVVLGGTIIAGSHLLNRHLCQTCDSCHH